MADRPMLMVYAYDIASPKVRTRVADLLEDHAVRVQDSVFEARLTKAAASRLFRHVIRLLDPGDLLRMYAITAAGMERSMTHGGAPLPEDGDYWIV
ncbi:MAG: CRISPR-associated endonuclease Cas2 [Pseudorhodoplanes sp.]|nr:MAG: CRISPR-associated endonuclease Cas2 [Pseudorhodoplanes sp.]